MSLDKAHAETAAALHPIFRGDGAVTAAASVGLYDGAGKMLARYQAG